MSLHNMFVVEGVVVRMSKPVDRSGRKFQTVRLSIRDVDSDVVNVVPFCFRVDKYPLDGVEVGDTISTSFKLLPVFGTGSSARRLAIVSAGTHTIVAKNEREREEERLKQFVEELNRLNEGRRGHKKGAW